MAGKADFMKREEELELEMEEKIAERKNPVQYSKMSEKEKIAERKPSEKDTTNTQSSKGFVDNCSKLNVREHPNIDAKVLTILNKGDKVQINSENDGWYSVVHKGVSGFCMKEYINKKEV